MKKWYQLLGFALSVLIFFWVARKAFREVEFGQLSAGMDLLPLTFNVVLGILIFLSTGFIMKIIFARHYQVRLSWPDILLLPSMMHLWSYILPVKGGMLFQVVFMRFKYKVGLSKGFSVGVLIFVISLFVTCVLGTGLVLGMEGINPLKLILLIMILVLSGTMLAIRFLPPINIDGKSFFGRPIIFLAKVVSQLRDQLSDRVLLLRILVVTLATSIIHIWWFYSSAILLGYSPNPIGIALATLLLRIILLFRFLPGNLGVQELVTGIVFTAAGIDFQAGLMIAIFMRIVSASIAVVFGLPALYANFRYFDAHSLKDVWITIKRQDNPEQ